MAWLVQRLCAKFCLDRFILSPSGGENPQFLPFFGLRYLVVSPVGGNLRKLNMDAQLKPSLSNGIKIVSVLQRLHGEIGRTVADVQKRDRQTDKQTICHGAGDGSLLHANEGGYGPLFCATFHPICATCRPCGVKTSKWASE